MIAGVEPVFRTRGRQVVGAADVERTAFPVTDVVVELSLRRHDFEHRVQPPLEIFCRGRRAVEFDPAPAKPTTYDFQLDM